MIQTRRDVKVSNYNTFSVFLERKYGEKVYKIPINIDCLCPNKDGVCSSGGCIFCGEEGAGFETLSNSLSVSDQIEMNIKYIGKKYNAKKFIAYFQNYSNTYIPLDKFKNYIEDSCKKDIVALYISTRPDCINDLYMEYLKSISENRNVDIVIELGLQTVNYHSLQFLNRGHHLSEFIDAVLRIKRYGLSVCAHMILDLPMDDTLDVIEGAKILSALNIDQVKCHSLFILEGTLMGDMYKKGELVPIQMEEFIERTILFLEYLDPNIVVQRLLGRAPKERSLFCSWGTSWRKIVKIIDEKMESRGRYQGKRFNFLNGSAIKKKF